MAKKLDGFKMSGRGRDASLYWNKISKKRGDDVVVDVIAPWAKSVKAGGILVSHKQGKGDGYALVVKILNVPRAEFADLVTAIRAEFTREEFDGWGMAF